MRRTTTRRNGRWTKRSGTNEHADRRLTRNGRGLLSLSERSPADDASGADLACRLAVARVAVGLCVAPDRHLDPLGQAVPDNEAAHGHLSGRQLRRLDIRSCQTGHRVLPSLDRNRGRVRGCAHRRTHRLGAEILMAVASVLPFVSYSSMTETLIPAAEWPTVYS